MKEFGDESSWGFVEKGKTAQVYNYALSARGVERPQGLAEQPVGGETVDRGQLAEPFKRYGPGPALVVSDGGRLESTAGPFGNSPERESVLFSGLSQDLPKRRSKARLTWNHTETSGRRHMAMHGILVVRPVRFGRKRA
jgi:hypothetical protein